MEARRFLDECVEAGVERHALLLRLSLLPRDMLRPHHLRMARVALEPLTMTDRARSFTLMGGDLLTVWRSEHEDLVADVTTELATLFAGAPVGRDTLLANFTLPAQVGALRAILQDERAPPVYSIQPCGSQPLDTSSLSALEDGLAQTDVTRFARRKSICRLDASGTLPVLWEKRYLLVSEIMATLLPERAAQDDRWLFRRLTRSLDRRMLALLSSRNELRSAPAFSLNLNVGSVLSPEFLRFDQVLPPRLRGHIVIDLHPADVIADLSAFLFARDFAHARQYSLLLRGLTPELLRMFPAERIGVDLVQLRWQPAMERVRLAELSVDPTRVVLARAAGHDALGWAAREGIAMIQQSRAASPREWEGRAAGGGA